MGPEELIVAVVVALLAAIPIFPSRAAYLAVASERREQVGNVVFWSVTKTTFVLGMFAMLFVLSVLSSDAPQGAANSGIMSRDMGLAVLLLLGAVALTFLWLGEILAGFVGTIIAKNLSARAAAAVVFASLSWAPVIAVGLWLSAIARSRARY